MVKVILRKKDYLTDFALPNTKDDRWFFDARWIIHELVHVWQFQLGFPVKTQGIIDEKNRFIAGKDAYEYSLGGKTDLSDFVMEAQADLLADYGMYINGLYKFKFTTWPQRIKNEIKLYGDSRYHTVLKNFLKNPKDKTLLPKKMDIVEDESNPNYLHQYFPLM